AEQEQGQRNERDEDLEGDRARPGEQVVLREAAGPEVDEGAEAALRALARSRHAEGLPGGEVPKSAQHVRLVGVPVEPERAKPIVGASEERLVLPDEPERAERERIQARLRTPEARGPGQRRISNRSPSAPPGP